MTTQFVLSFDKYNYRVGQLCLYTQSLRDEVKSKYASSVDQYIRFIVERQTSASSKIHQTKINYKQPWDWHSLADRVMSTVTHLFLPLIRSDRASRSGWPLHPEVSTLQLPEATHRSKLPSHEMLVDAITDNKTPATLTALPPY